MSVFSLRTVNPSVCAIEFGGMSRNSRFRSPVNPIEVAALLRFLSFRIEPDADFGAGGDLLAHGVQMLIPRDLLAGQQQLASAFAEEIVALADRPLHQLRPSVDEILDGDAIRPAEPFAVPVLTASGSLLRTR